FTDIHQFPQETSKEILQARDDLMEAIHAFLKEYDHIPPNEKYMALLLVEEKFLNIKRAIEEEKNQPEVLQELLLKLMNDLQILKEIQPKKFSRISFEVMPKVLLIAWERFGEIKYALTDKQYQQEDIQELMSKLLKDIFFDSNDDYTSSDDDDFDDIKYIKASPLDSELVSLEEKLLNVSRLITNIESWNDNPTPNRVLKSPSLIPIPVTDSDSFFEESDTPFSHSGLTSIVISDHLNDPLLELSEFESFHFDPSFPRPPPKPPDVKICLNFKPDAPMLNNIDVLNEDECFDPRGGEIVLS
ncbi:hypothetical protein Tco_0173556, partial [Tanacetum coccineum]